MAVGLSGVFTGMDTETLIARLMAVNARPMYQLQDRRAEWEARQDALTDISSRLSTFKTLLARLRDGDGLRHVSAVSSDTGTLTVNAGSGAGEGTHQVVIDRLARSHKLVHTAGLAGLDSTVGAAKSTALNTGGVADPDAVWFTTTANGATYTFDFGDEPDIDNVAFAADTGYSMNQVAGLINARSQAVAGYDAAVVEYDDQLGQHVLRISAQNAGTTGTMTQTLTAGDAVDELNDDADWQKTASGEGKLRYTYDGVTRTLHVTDETTLEDLCDLINNDGANPGVTASVLEAGGAYHLILAGRDTGSDYGVTIDDFQTTLNGFDTSDFTETQAAQDARLRVDGYPADPNWIERSGNTITDVLPGLTLNLRDTGTVTVTLNRNTSDLSDDLNNFVAIYNGLVTAVENYTGYDAETETGGIMQGDATLNGVLTGIRNLLIGTATGFVDGEDAYTLPVEIGIAFDRYGQLSLVGTSTETQTSLDDALAADYAGVLELIGARASGQSDSSYIQFDAAEADTGAGFYDVAIDFAADGGIVTARIKGADEEAWRFMEIDGNTLYGTVGTDEEGLVLTAVNDGTGGEHTQTAQVRIRQGFAGALYDHVDALLDATSGPMAGKDRQITEAIEELDERIEDQEDRLEDQEERLRGQFARLEALLATYDRQLAAVQQLSQQVNSFANFLSNR